MRLTEMETVRRGSPEPGTDDAEGAPVPHDGPVVGQVMRPGYRWKGTVIRPAMVMVHG